METAEEGQAPVVTLTTQAGKTVTCTLHRDPSRDREEGDPRGQVRYWRAVPDEEVELGTFEVTASTVPPRTAFYVDVPSAGFMEGLGQ